MKSEDLRAMFSQVAGPMALAAKEQLAATLTELDQDPVGHVAFEVLRARVRGELDGREALLAVIHEATRKRPA